MKPQVDKSNLISEDDSNQDEDVISSNTSRINTDTNNNINLIFLTRGFNQFLLYGMSPEELHTLRLLFHSAIYYQHMQRNSIIDWSQEAMLRREEEWLRAQLNSNTTNANRAIRNPLLSILVRDDLPTPLFPLVYLSSELLNHLYQYYELLIWVYNNQILIRKNHIYFLALICYQFYL